jgi:predicted Zn-dependent protease
MDLSALTDDGQELSDEMYIEYSFSEQLPDLQTYIKQCEEFIFLFLELRKAPIIDEAYNGPVLIEKMALAETFQNQVVRPSLIAKRQAISGYRGNNMEIMMNKKIISRSLSIKSLSGTEIYKGIHLDGYYPVDAEGVIPDKELVLVENGVLKNLLNGRTPTKKIRHSNGHSRFNS